MREKISLSKRGGQTFKEGYDQFILEKRAMNVSPETVLYYDLCYKMFSAYIGENALCQDISSQTVIGYIMHIRETKPEIRDVTINTYLRGVRAVLYNLMAKGYVNQFKVNLLRAEKRIKETYTDYELDLLLKKPNLKTASFIVYRNWAIICYLLATGNRASTVCNVRIGDVDFENHEIKLKKVKNKKQYTILLSKTLEKVLLEYLEYRKGSPDDLLFCTQYGEQMTRAALISTIQLYNKSRGVTKTSIHLFRHTFAKKWILNNGDIFRLQQILGHSSIEIVKEYVNIYGRDLHQGFEAFNPLDNMNTDLNRQKISLKNNRFNN